MTTDARTATDVPIRSALRLAATLLLTGQVLFVLVTQFHTGGDANDHQSIFAKYAHSGDCQLLPHVDTPARELLA